MLVQGPGRYGEVAVINDLDAVDVLVGLTIHWGRGVHIIGISSRPSSTIYYTALRARRYPESGLKPLDHFVHCGAAVNMVIVETAVGMVKR